MLQWLGGVLVVTQSGGIHIVHKLKEDVMLLHCAQVWM